jgi:nucleoside-diphosphate-sugar epimerase
VDSIVHIASLQIPASDANPHLALRINSEGTLNIFELARLMDVKKTVWASSSAVYGPVEKYGNKPVANDAPHYPTTVYGACKSLNERMAAHYFDTYGLDNIGFRFTAVYGIGRIRGKSSFTTKMIEMAAYDKPYLVPYGDDLIDFQYIEDASAILLQALRLQRKTQNRVFNTQGDVRPVVEGVKYLKTLAPEADLKMEPGTFGIPWRYDTSELEREVGFKPRYSMEEGIKKTFEGFKSRRLLSHPR